MTEPSSSPNESVSQTTNRRIRWDALAAIIAALIGLLALCVSGYTAYVQRQQVRAQVWPHLSVGQSDFPPSLTVVNQGVGPALVRSVEVLVDGKPQPDWEHVFAAEGMHGDIHRLTSKLSGAVLSPGQKLTWLNFEFTRSQFQDMVAMIEVERAASAASTGGAPAPRSTPDANYDQVQGKQRLLFNRFWTSAQQRRMQVRICYCSTLGECRLTVWNVDGGSYTANECLAVPNSQRFSR